MSSEPVSTKKQDSSIKPHIIELREDSSATDASDCGAGGSGNSDSGRLKADKARDSSLLRSAVARTSLPLGHSLRLDVRSGKRTFGVGESPGS